MSENALWGSMHWSSFRWGLYQTPTFFQKIWSRIKIAFGSAPVVWLESMITGYDADTGKPYITFIEHDIDALVRPVRAEEAPLEPGLTVDDFWKIWALDGIKQGDRVRINGALYEVLPPQESFAGATFMHRRALLKRLKMEVSS